MKEIMISENPDSELKEEGSSYEMAALYKVFHDLIQDKLFSQNAFLQRPDEEDIVSIMDLAKTCLMYQSEKNIKAAGVCYNNIANLHFKNGKFLIAAHDFCKAIRLATEQINIINKQQKDASEFEEVRAHRTYQLAISNYKYVRYNLKGNSQSAGRNEQAVDDETQITEEISNPFVRQITQNATQLLVTLKDNIKSASQMNMEAQLDTL